MKSDPVALEFAGWKSDSYTLQRAGWEVSADQDVHNDRMSIAIRHPAMGIGGVTHYAAGWPYGRGMREMRYFEPGAVRYPILEMKLITGCRERVYFTSELLGVPRRYNPIDAVPSFIEFEPKSLEDLAHFASYDSKRILLPEKTVEGLMKEILAMQDPARQAHFMKQQEERRRESPLRLEAQIMSFAV